MKRFHVVLLVSIIACSNITFAYEIHKISISQISNDIKKYYKEVFDTWSVSIEIIDVLNTEEEKTIKVYFLENKSISLAKDFYGNIDSSKVPVMVAQYYYSVLKNRWVLQKIEKVEDKMIFQAE